MRFLKLRPSLAFLTSSLYFSTNIEASTQQLSNATSSRSNPLFLYRELPKFNDIVTENIQSDIQTILKETKRNFNTLEQGIIKKNNDINYSLVVEELEKIQYPITFSWAIIAHLMSVKNTEELRQIYQTLQPSIIQFNQEVGQSKVFYDSLSTVKRNVELWNSLDEAQQRIVDSTIRNMNESGVGLSTPERNIFNQFKLELSELSTKFSNNVLDSTKEFKLVLTTTADIEGLPASAKGLLAQQAVAQGYKEVFLLPPLLLLLLLHSSLFDYSFLFSKANAETGPWVVTLDLPSYLACMQHLKSRHLRETLYRAYVTRASSGDKDNSVIIRDILRKRRAVAKMLVIIFYYFFISYDLFFTQLIIDRAIQHMQIYLCQRKWLQMLKQYFHC